MNVVATIAPESSPAHSLFPSAQELSTLKEMAGMFIASGLLPSAIKKPEQAILIMLKGKEAGVPALQALAHIHVIEGKPSMSAELMLSQLYKNIPGFAHQFVETSNNACRIKVKRPGMDWSDFAFTIDDARAAGLANRGPWKSYPAAMLRARCISGMARAVGPDALAGISYTPEELGVDVDAGGNPVGIAAGQEKVNDLNARLGLKDVTAEVEPREPSAREKNEKAFLDHVEKKSPVIITPKSPEPDVPVVTSGPSPESRPNAFWVPKIGPFKRMLKDCPADELTKYYDTLKARSAGKEIAPEWSEFLEKVGQYLGVVPAQVEIEASSAPAGEDLFERFPGGPVGAA